MSRLPWLMIAILIFCAFTVSSLRSNRFFDPERPFAALRANRSDRPFADSLSVKPMGLSTRYQYERGREAGGQLPERGF